VRQETGNPADNSPSCDFPPAVAGTSLAGQR
jgi:hypothetical protein